MQKGIVPQTDFSEGLPELDYSFSENAMKYLDMMRELCAEQSVELILMKAPTNSWKYWWHEEWDAQVEEYAKKHSLSYYNFIPCADEMGIDMSHDTYDAGMHLNVWGAEKFTEYFGRILAERHGLPDRRAESELVVLWQEKLDRYYAQRNS
jgi:hypothetical protein